MSEEPAATTVVDNPEMLNEGKTDARRVGILTGVLIIIHFFLAHINFLGGGDCAGKDLMFLNFY